MGVGITFRDNLCGIGSFGSAALCLKGNTTLMFVSHFGCLTVFLEELTAHNPYEAVHLKPTVIPGGQSYLQFLGKS